VSSKLLAQIAIVLHVYNYAGVGADVLWRAQVEATRVYEAIGVNITWVDAGSDFDTPDARAEISVAILPESMAARRQLGSDVLGCAPGTVEERGRIAFALYDRIKGVTRHDPLAVGRVLGLVIAHEVGHLLLPYGSHSERGIMHDNWDVNSARFILASDLGFTDEQGELIRSRLALEEITSPLR
jgi:hypothetical protein